MNMCKLLVANFAEYESDMFGSFPCPHDMAVAMEANDIVNFFNTSSQNSECPVVTLIQNDIYGLHTAAINPQMTERMTVTAAAFLLNSRTKDRNVINSQQQSSGM